MPSPATHASEVPPTGVAVGYKVVRPVVRRSISEHLIERESYRREMTVSSSVTPLPVLTGRCRSLQKLQHDFVARQRQHGSQKRATYLRMRGLEPVDAGVVASLAEARAAENRLPQVQALVVRNCIEMIRAADRAAAISADLDAATVNLECLDVSLPDFVVICYALSAVRHVRRVSLIGAVLTPSHFRVLLNAIERRPKTHPIEDIEVDDALRTDPSLAVWCSRLRHSLITAARSRGVIIGRTDVGTNTRSVMLPHVSHGNTRKVDPEERQTAIDHHQQHSELSRCKAAEKAQRDAIEKTYRGGLAKLRTVFKRVFAILQEIQRSQRKRRIFAGILRDVAAAETKVRARLFSEEWSAFTGMALKFVVSQREAIEENERRDRRALWAEYTFDFDFSKRTRNNRLSRDRRDRLILTQQHALGRIQIIEEHWDSYHALYTTHIEATQMLRLQSQSLWSGGGRCGAGGELPPVTNSNAPTEGDRKRRGAGAGSNRSAMKEKMDDVLRQRTSVLAAQETASRVLLSHHADGEEIVERVVLHTVFHQILYLAAAAEAVLRCRDRFWTLYETPPLLRLWVPSDAAHPAVFETLPVQPGNPTAVVHPCNGVNVALEMPAAWDAALVGAYAHWCRAFAQATVTTVKACDTVVTSAFDVMSRWYSSKSDQLTFFESAHAQDSEMARQSNPARGFWIESRDAIVALVRRSASPSTMTDQPLDVDAPPGDDSAAALVDHMSALRSQIDHLIRRRLSVVEIHVELRTPEDDGRRAAIRFTPLLNTAGEPTNYNKTTSPEESWLPDVEPFSAVATASRRYCADGVAASAAVQDIQEALRQVVVVRYDTGNEAPFSVALKARVRVLPTVVGGGASDVEEQIGVAYCVFPATISLNDPPSGALLTLPYDVGASSTVAPYVFFMPTVTLRPQPHFVTLAKDEIHASPAATSASDAAGCFTHHVLQVDPSPASGHTQLDGVVLSWQCSPADPDDDIILASIDAPEAPSTLTIMGHIIKLDGVRIATSALERSWFWSSSDGHPRRRHRRLILTVTFEGQVPVDVVCRVMRQAAFRNASGEPLLGRRIIRCRLRYTTVAASAGGPDIGKRATFRLSSPLWWASSLTFQPFPMLEDKSFSDDDNDVERDDTVQESTLRASPVFMMMPYEVSLNIDVLQNTRRMRWSFGAADVLDWFPASNNTSTAEALHPTVLQLAPNCHISSLDGAHFGGGVITARLHDDDDAGHLELLIPMHVVNLDDAARIKAPFLSKEYSISHDSLSLQWTSDWMSAELRLSGSVVGRVERTVIPHPGQIGTPAGRCVQVTVTLMNGPEGYFVWHTAAAAEILRSIGFARLWPYGTGERESVIDLRFQIGVPLRWDDDGSTAQLRPRVETLQSMELHHEVRVKHHATALTDLAPQVLRYKENSGGVPVIAQSPSLHPSAASASSALAEGSPVDPCQPSRNIRSVTVGVSPADVEELDDLYVDLDPAEYVVKPAESQASDVAAGEDIPTVQRVFQYLQSRYSAGHGIVKRACSDGVVSTLEGDAAIFAAFAGAPRALAAAVILARLRSALLDSGIISVRASRLLPGLKQDVPRTYEVYPASSSPTSSIAASWAKITSFRRGDLCIALSMDAGMAPLEASTFVLDLLAALRFRNTDRNPRLLEKSVALRLRHVAGGENTVPITVLVEPFDDPTEIVVDFPGGGAGMVYRPGTTEVEPWPGNTAKTVSKYRERFRDLQPLAKAFPECTATAASDDSASSPRVGSLPLFVPPYLTIADPDTEHWDGGSVTVRCASGWMPCCVVHMLSVAQQLVLRKCVPDLPPYVITVSADGVVRMARSSHEDGGEQKIGWLSQFPDAMRITRAVGRSAAASPYAPMNDIDPGEEEPELGDETGTFPDTASPSLFVRATEPVEVLRIDFDAPRNAAVAERIDLSIIRYICACIALRTRHGVAPTETTRLRFELEIRDARCRTPGRGALHVDVLPRQLSVPLGADSPNASNVRLLQSISPPGTVPPNTVLVYSARTSGAAVGGEPVFPTIITAGNLTGSEKLAEGSFIEVFFSQGAQPKDVISLRLAGTNISLTTDGLINCGREGVFGRIFALAHYIRIDVPSPSKVATYKRLQQLLRCVCFRVTEGDPRDAVGDRTLTVVFCDGRRDLFGRLECTAEHFVIKVVADLPLVRS